MDRPRRRERKRNGDGQTLSVVRHFVRETQDKREVKRCKWGRGKRQRLTRKQRRGFTIVRRRQRLKGIVRGERKVRIRVSVAVRVRSEDSNRVRVRKSRR